MNVLIYSTRDFEIPYIKAANKKLHILGFVKESLSISTVHLAKGYNAVVIFSADKAEENTLQELRKIGVKHIALRSAGYDNIDLIAAKKTGIQVANVPSYSPYAIAEHAVGLLLALNRNLIASNKKVEKFNFDINGLLGFDLKGKKVGIIGTGRIGGVMAKIMNGFGCHLLGYDLEKEERLTEEYNLVYVSLEELCEQSDIISIHLPLNKDTYHLINEKLINLMKKGVYIINTGRGAILKTSDILKGLENEKIGALGIDVYEFEKGIFFKDYSNTALNDKMLEKLIEMPNVLVTSHHAFLTANALTNIADTTFENLNAWENGRLSENELTI